MLVIVEVNDDMAVYAFVLLGWWLFLLDILYLGLVTDAGALLWPPVAVVMLVEAELVADNALLVDVVDIICSLISLDCGMLDFKAVILLLLLLFSTKQRNISQFNVKNKKKLAYCFGPILSTKKRRT